MPSRVVLFPSSARRSTSLQTSLPMAPESWNPIPSPELRILSVVFSLFPWMNSTKCAYAPSTATGIAILSVAPPKPSIRLSESHPWPPRKPPESWRVLRLRLDLCLIFQFLGTFSVQFHTLHQLRSIVTGKQKFCSVTEV